MSRPNIYKLLPKKYLKNTYYNPNKRLIDHPSRILIIGSSGSFKTSTLIWFIDESKNFHKIYLYAKKLNEPLYEWLIDEWTKKSEKLGQSLIEYSNSVDDIVQVDSIDDSIQNLIIFDDFITERNLTRVSELFIRSRKQNCTLCFISQRYHAIPSDVRINSTHFMFMNGISGRELINISVDQSGMTDSETFKEMYRKATKDGGFLLVDTVTTDPKKRFRKNFYDTID